MKNMEHMKIDSVVSFCERRTHHEHEAHGFELHVFMVCAL